MIAGEYGNIGGHSKSGYHVFELGFVANVYLMVYLPRSIRQHTAFTVHFRPDPAPGVRALNCLPDAVAPGTVAIQDVLIDGVPRSVADPNDLRFPLRPEDLGKKAGWCACGSRRPSSSA